jgi:hypothetical protein
VVLIGGLVERNGEIGPAAGAVGVCNSPARETASLHTKRATPSTDDGEAPQLPCRLCVHRDFDEYLLLSIGRALGNEYSTTRISGCRRSSAGDRSNAHCCERQSKALAHPIGDNWMQGGFRGRDGIPHINLNQASKPWRATGCPYRAVRQRSWRTLNGPFEASAGV